MSVILPAGAVSLRAYAKDKDVTEAAVRKAIKAEKIVKAVIRDPKTGKVAGIMAELADAEWKLAYSPNYKRHAGLAKRFSNQDIPAKSTPEVPAGVPESMGASLPPGATPSKQMISKADADRAKAVYDAKIKELEYRRLVGEQVARKDVYEALYQIGNELKQALLNIPNRIIANLRAAKTQNEAHELLTEAITNALMEVDKWQDKELDKK